MRNAGELGLGAAEIPWCGTDEEVIDLIKEARDGAEAAQKILLELAAATIERSAGTIRPSQRVVIEFLRDPKKPGRGRAGRKLSDYAARDLFIFLMILQIKTKWKLPATRNEATRSASAVSVMQKALEKVGIHLTEAAVTKIWKSVGKK